ncbi:PEP-CTERM sorting domain-containing protein [Neptunicella sp. SCSIO 80796]|uniref:PEP-CTERM sorting domain-containing protein n=1 Tax=Neptunicella plasticusilytica TaxID=3117012 RepID=UPI003A4D959F
MKKHLVCPVILLLLVVSSAYSPHANSALITHRGYTLDTNTQIFTDGDVEWLRWDLTVGMSINQALTLYQAEGWRLTSNSQMVQLYKDFFSGFDWNSTLGNDDISIGEYVEVRYFQAFASIVGVTLDAFGGIIDVLYGDDPDADGYYRMASAYYTDYDPGAGLGSDQFNRSADYNRSDVGIALSRVVTQTVVPEPASLWVLITGLLVIGGLSRRTKMSGLN